LKPKGVPTAKRLRPITLMSIIRKIMEIIILNQIYPYLDAYISRNQSAQCNRSTAHIIWTYQYQSAFAEQYNRKQSAFVYFLDIDLTKAFDMVDRNLLLQILNPLIPTSSLMMLRYLMAETALKVIIGHTVQDNPGALSTLLFAAYMEASLKLHTIYNYYNAGTATFFDTENVDDCDFITNDPNIHHLLDVLLPDYFHPYQLLINQQ